MGLTLVAILTGALLLPGLIAVYFYYRAGKTKEADPVLPALGSARGLVQIGTFAVLVHFLYALGLWVIARMPSCFALPLADPYRVPDPRNQGLANHHDQVALFAGLFWLIIVAALVGHIAGEIVRSTTDRTAFHGPLTAILDKADGPDAFITAYVLTKIESDDFVLGYEGTVTSVTRDAELLPEKIVLKDARPFRIKISEGGRRKEENGAVMDCLVLRSDDWHNIAFRVYQLTD